MKIRIVLSNFYPEEIALTNRISALIPLLASRHKVVVVFLLQPKREFDEAGIREKFPHPNLEFVPVPSIAYNKRRFVLRFIFELINCLRLWVIAITKPADITWVSIPQLPLLPVSALFVPFCRSKNYVEIRDLTWLSINFGKGFVSKALSRFLNRLCLYSVARFDRVIACTDAQAQYLNEHTDLQITVVRNGISKERFDRLTAIGPPRRGTGITTVTYIGNVGYAQNLKTFANVASMFVNDPSLRFVIAGDGLGLDQLRLFVSKHGLTNLLIKGGLPWSETISLYENSDILYAQLRSDPGFNSAEPSKLFEYLATGRPIIFGSKGQAKTLAEKFDNVRVIEPENEQALRLAIDEQRSAPTSIASHNRTIIAASFIREKIFQGFLHAEQML